jgi:hypothetical protein
MSPCKLRVCVTANWELKLALGDLSQYDYWRQNRQIRKDRSAEEHPFAAGPVKKGAFPRIVHCRSNLACAFSGFDFGVECSNPHAVVVLSGEILTVGYRTEAARVALAQLGTSARTE